MARAVLIREATEHFKLRAEPKILMESSFPNLSKEEIPAAQAQSRLAIFEATQFILGQLEEGGLLEEGQRYLADKWGQELIQEFEVPSISELGQTASDIGSNIAQGADKVAGAANNVASTVAAGGGAIVGGAPVEPTVRGVAEAIPAVAQQGYDTGLSGQPAGQNPIEAAQVGHTAGQISSAVSDAAPIVGGAALTGAAALAAKNAMQNKVGSGPVPNATPAAIPAKATAVRTPLRRRA